MIPSSPHSLVPIALLPTQEAVASHEGACPEGIKAFHCRRMKHASYELLLPDSEKEPEVQGDAANELPEATPEQLKLTICTSWAATKGLFAFMKEHKNGPSDPPSVQVPLCARAHVPERGVLYGVDQNTEATAVTQVVGQKGAWVPNELTIGLVGMLRRRGVLDQLVVDRERRIMYCGVPKAGMTFFKSWFLKRHGLWDVLNRKRAQLGFGGPRNGGVEKLVDGRHMRDDEIMEVLNDGGYFKVCCADTYPPPPASLCARVTPHNTVHLREGSAGPYSRRLQRTLRRVCEAGVADGVPAVDEGADGVLGAARQGGGSDAAGDAAHPREAEGRCGRDVPDGALAAADNRVCDGAYCVRLCWQNRGAER